MRCRPRRRRRRFRADVRAGAVGARHGERRRRRPRRGAGARRRRGAGGAAHHRALHRPARPPRHGARPAGDGTRAAARARLEVPPAARGPHADRAASSASSAASTSSRSCSRGATRRTAGRAGCRVWPATGCGSCPGPARRSRRRRPRWQRAALALRRGRTGPGPLRCSQHQGPFKSAPREAGKEPGMTTATGKVVMDDDALRRTLVRIAHEIVEKNPDMSDVCLVGIYTRGVAIAQRLRREIALATGLRARRRRPRHLLLPRRRDLAAAASCTRRALDFAHRRAHRRAGGRRALHRPHDPGRDRRAVRLRAPVARSGSPCWPIAGTASCRSAPTTWARTFRPSADERVFVRLVEIDEVDEVTIR